MDLNILDTSFNKMYIVDEYKSLIWNDRYNKAGDFELYVPASETNFQIFQNGYYITSDISDHVMIIEDMSVTTDVESGAFLIISGRSIESILDRRIVWTQTNISSYAYVYDAISRLLNDNICGSSIGNRRVPEFSQTLNIDVPVRSIRNIYDMQFTGDNLYDTIVKICNTYGIGFEMYLENNKFVFSHVKKGKRAAELEDALQWLRDAGLITQLELVEKPELPLSSVADATYFKVYLSDLGLLRRKSGLSFQTILDEDALFMRYKGSLAENYVLNELLTQGEQVFFWRSDNTAEIDILMESDGRIIPMEVKSADNTRAKSYHEFCKRYSLDVGYKISMKNIGESKIERTRTVSLPLYLVWNWKRYL